MKLISFSKTAKEIIAKDVEKNLEAIKSLCKVVPEYFKGNQPMITGILNFMLTPYLF